MTSRTLFLIVGCIVGFCLVASFSVHEFRKGDHPESSTSSPDSVSPILVAKCDIESGDPLGPGNCCIVNWPDTEIPGGVLNDLRFLDGNVASMRLLKGTPILNASASRPELRIQQGYQVVNLKGYSSDLVAGLACPGDKLNLAAGFQQKDSDEIITRTFARNVTLFAISTCDFSGKGRCVYSVLVTDKTAEQIKLVRRIGSVLVEPVLLSDDTRHTTRAVTTTADVGCDFDDSAKAQGLCSWAFQEALKKLKRSVIGSVFTCDADSALDSE